MGRGQSFQLEASVPGLFYQLSSLVILQVLGAKEQDFLKMIKINQ